MREEINLSFSSRLDSRRLKNIINYLMYGLDLTFSNQFDFLYSFSSVLSIVEQSSESFIDYVIQIRKRNVNSLFFLFYSFSFSFLWYRWNFFDPSLRGDINRMIWILFSEIFLFFYFNISWLFICLGITEVSTVAGSDVEIPCNTTWIEDEVSLVLWFRGDTGVPIYRVDARNVPLAKAIHTSNGDEAKRKRLYFDVNRQPPVLHIKPVLSSDAAEYRCRVDFRQSRTQNVIVLLNVTGIRHYKWQMLCCSSNSIIRK